MKELMKFWVQYMHVHLHYTTTNNNSYWRHPPPPAPISTEFWKIVRLFYYYFLSLFIYLFFFFFCFFFCFSNVMSNEWSLANIDVRKFKSWSITTPDKDTCKLFRRRSYKRMIIRHAEDSEILANPQMAYNEINCWRWWCKKLRSVVCTDIYK